MLLTQMKNGKRKGCSCNLPGFHNHRHCQEGGGGEARIASIGIITAIEIFFLENSFNRLELSEWLMTRKKKGGNIKN